MKWLLVALMARAGVVGFFDRKAALLRFAHAAPEGGRHALKSASSERVGPLRYDA
jgi:hypothetical protein